MPQFFEIAPGLCSKVVQTHKMGPFLSLLICTFWQWGPEPFSIRWQWPSGMSHFVFMNYDWKWGFMRQYHSSFTTLLFFLFPLKDINFWGPRQLDTAPPPQNRQEVRNSPHAVKDPAQLVDISEGTSRFLIPSRSYVISQVLSYLAAPTSLVSEEVGSCELILLELLWPSFSSLNPGWGLVLGSLHMMFPQLPMFSPTPNPVSGASFSFVSSLPSGEFLGEVSPDHRILFLYLMAPYSSPKSICYCSTV